MNIDPKLLISLLIFFLSEHMLSKPTYGIIPRPTFEEFVEQIKTGKISKGQKLSLNIPTPEELEKEDFQKNNILHIAIENDHYGVLEYILSDYKSKSKNTELKKMITAKNEFGQTALRLSLELNRMKFAHLIAKYTDEVNILGIDKSLFLDALKIQNPDSINDFIEILQRLKNNVLNLDDENDTKKLLLEKDKEGNIIHHLILQNKVLPEIQKKSLFSDCWFDDFDINLENNSKKSILDYAAIAPSNEIKKMFKVLGLELPLKLGILKNNLEKLKLKLISLQSSLKKLQASLIAT